MTARTTDRVPPPENHRPWYRLHLSTVCLLIPAAAALALLVVPGDIVTGEPVFMGPFAFGGGPFDFEHGWPYVWLERRVTRAIAPASEQPIRGIPWLYGRAWGFRGDEREVRPGMLAIDILVVLLLLGLFAAAVEWRRRRRAHFWQFTVTGSLAVTAMIACGLSWYQHNRSVWQRESQLFEEPASGTSHFCDHMDYRGPLWLRRLFGKRNPQVFYRVTTVYLGRPEPDAGGFGHRAEQLETLSSLEILVVSLGCGLADGAAPDAGDKGSLAFIAELPRLRELYLYGPSISVEDSPHLEPLRELHVLEGLLIWGCVDDAGLAHFSGLANLRRLNLSSGRLEGSGLSHLRGLHKLEFLDLRGTDVDMKHVDRLREDLPNCCFITDKRR